MNGESEAFLPLWMLISAAFGFLIGDVVGDSTRHRKCLQQVNDELRQHLEESAANAKPIQRALKEQRGIINDIHSRLVGVSKSLEKRPS